MPRRTSPNDLQHWEDASDLEHLVVDKRSHKRATPAKGRRRNRRYEKRLLNHYLENSEDLELELDAPGGEASAPVVE
ncbi:hypothetical protein [Leptolyngbya sp. O-77]|uniref:hypothetical protein n=1 Tax=Leptolyngbya sp. O-77 TaxID=1080068 RepID=UPI00074D3FB0|nr:hypothetical protein [Leptolyngbya sp. O-77]BAU42445.1 hypothetical protein O77CONTIG1_02266 [Leptolyngbya sp. O-77]